MLKDPEENSRISDVEVSGVREMGYAPRREVLSNHFSLSRETLMMDLSMKNPYIWDVYRDISRAIIRIASLYYKDSSTIISLVFVSNRKKTFKIYLA